MLNKNGTMKMVVIEMLFMDMTAAANGAGLDTGLDRFGAQRCADEPCALYAKRYWQAAIAELQGKFLGLLQSEVPCYGSRVRDDGIDARARYVLFI